MDILNLYSSNKIKGDKELININHNIINLLLYLDLEDVKKIICKIYKITELPKTIIKKNEYNILGIGGYGIIFELNNNKCIKLTLNFSSNKNENNEFETSKEYIIPIELSKKNSELKDLINVPLCYIEDIKTNGLENYLRLVYSIFILIKNPNINHDQFLKKIVKINPNIIINNDHIFKYLKIYNKYVNLPNLIIFYKFKEIIKLINKFKLKENKNYNKILIIYEKAIDSANNHIYNIEENHNIVDGNFYKVYFRSLFLQVSLFLLKANENNYFIHRDLKPDNILVFNTKKNYSITYKNYEFNFKNKIIFKINDFSFSKLEDKNKTHKKYTILYDIHYFTHFFFLYFYDNLKDHDENLFNFLYKKFIEPYCNQSINELNTLKKIKKNIICYEGKLNYDNNYKSKDLEKVILKNKLFNYFK